MSASAAKARLKDRQFFFNDATTHQDKFTAKLRKHCKLFSTTLQDFAYSHRHWPEHDNNLSHTMIVDAFLAGFSSTDTTQGSDGTTLVPKCSNLRKICEKIRENKTRSLEDLMALIIDDFERIDNSIKGNKTGMVYPIQPWRLGQTKNKRSFNQVTNGGSNQPSQGRTAKIARPATNYPRCNNCGSKGHLCGERTCFLFGHPKGKGINGNFPEGTPSLTLDANEWKAWKSTRNPIFRAYPENQNKAKPPLPPKKNTDDS